VKYLRQAIFIKKRGIELTVLEAASPMAGHQLWQEHLRGEAITRSPGKSESDSGVGLPVTTLPARAQDSVKAPG
jgi:hypothetical protein